MSFFTKYVEGGSYLNSHSSLEYSTNDIYDILIEDDRYQENASEIAECTEEINSHLEDFLGEFFDDNEEKITEFILGLMRNYFESKEVSDEVWNTITSEVRNKLNVNI